MVVCAETSQSEQGFETEEYALPAIPEIIEYEFADQIRTMVVWTEPIWSDLRTEAERYALPITPVIRDYDDALTIAKVVVDNRLNEHPDNCAYPTYAVYDPENDVWLVGYCFRNKNSGYYANLAIAMEASTGAVLAMWVEE